MAKLTVSRGSDGRFQVDAVISMPMSLNISLKTHLPGDLQVAALAIAAQATTAKPVA